MAGTRAFENSDMINIRANIAEIFRITKPCLRNPIRQIIITSFDVFFQFGRLVGFPLCQGKHNCIAFFEFIYPNIASSSQIRADERDEDCYYKNYA